MNINAAKRVLAKTECKRDIVMDMLDILNNNCRKTRKVIASKIQDYQIDHSNVDYVDKMIPIYCVLLTTYTVYELYNYLTLELELLEKRIPPIVNCIAYLE